MAESKGPPRKTTTYNRFSTMASQNQRYNTKQDEFYWLENIMRVAPHKLHSVPGPGAPHFFPFPQPGCIDTSFRGQGQSFLEIVTAFDQATTFGGGNLRSSWGYIHNGEFNSVVAQAVCGGGNAPYTATCSQINHYTGDNPTVASFNAPPIQDANCRLSTAYIGNSNVNVWRTNTPDNLGDRFWLNNGNSFVDCEPLPTSNFGGVARTNFAIDDTEIWVFLGPFLDGGPPYVEFIVFSRSGVKLHDFYSFGNDAVFIANYMLTANYLYALGHLGSTYTIWKISRVDGSIVDSVEVTNLDPNFIAVANDNLIYLLSNGNPAKVYYLENFFDMVYVGRCNGQGITPFGGGTAIWDNSNLYYGSNGFAGFTTDIFKIAIECPPETGVVIASVTTDATVAAGAAINVSWHDVLLPDATDGLIIKPEPAAGVFGLVGSTIASAVNSSALTDGTVSITIPGGTTPGNYVAMYGALGTIWVATSAPFTVT